MMILRAGAAAALLLALLPAAAGGAGVSATVVPAGIRLTSGETQVVHVVVTNGTSGEITDVVARGLAAGAKGLEVTMRRTDARTIAPGAATQFVLRVRATAPVLSETTVNALVSYRQGATRGTLNAAIKVSPPPALDPAKLATLDVKATFGDLRSHRDTPVYVTVANTSAETLTVGPPTLTGPDFLHLCDPSVTERCRELTATTEVAAHATHRITADLRADKDVDPGKHQLVFAVPVTAGATSVALTSVQEGSVSVDGESELLTAAGVPSLILVPGLLLLGVTTLLWELHLFRHRSDAATFPLDPKSAQFLALSVTVSVLVIWLWPKAGGANLFDRYGREDVLTLWGVSIAIGVAVYALPMGFRFAYKARRTPKATDSAAKVLRKLDRQKLTLCLPVRKQTHDGKAVDAFMLQPYDDARPRTWFSQAIEVTFAANASQKTRDEVAAAVDSHDAKRLADLAERNGEVTFGWPEQAPVQSPFAVKADAVGNPAPPAVIAVQV